MVVFIVLVAVAGAQQARQWQEFRESPLASSGNFAMVLKGMLRESGISGVPIVISSGLDYLHRVLWQRPLDPSIVSLLDPEKAVAYDKTDSIDVGLRHLNAYWPLNTQEFRLFRRVTAGFWSSRAAGRSTGGRHG